MKTKTAAKPRSARSASTPANNRPGQDKKDLAKLLFMSGDITQKEIAERVHITEKTLGNWIKTGNWGKLKKSLITSKGDQLRRLYDIMAALTTAIEKTDYGDTKLADMMIKYTAAIRNLETETSAGQMFETGMQFISFVDKDNHNLAKDITNYFDAFITKELNHKF